MCKSMQMRKNCPVFFFFVYVLLLKFLNIYIITKICDFTKLHANQISHAFLTPAHVPLLKIIRTIIPIVTPKRGLFFTPNKFIFSVYVLCPNIILTVEAY